MALPAIDFDLIARTAKDALLTYGTSVTFFEQNDTNGRAIHAVIYRDDRTEALDGDASSVPATCILNPDEFIAPHRMPKRFDKIQVTVGGFARTYNVESAHPILAQETLPLLLVQLRSN